jgi:mono/diheme cytochrome c family protein
MRKLVRKLSHVLSSWVTIFHFCLAICDAGVLPPHNTKAPLPGADTINIGRSIELPHFEPDLAMAPGRDDFMVVCVSCHSPRYVTMQPPFSQRQWEESVDKMAKVYGAQFDVEQRKSIIGYLVATHGPTMATPEAPERDEEFDLASLTKPPPPPETAPLLTLAADATEHGAELSRGEALFNQDCTGCHGVRGGGDGFVGRLLLRKPKNLAGTRFSLKLLSQVLWNGRRGTAMPSWRNLPQSDLVALTAYVQSLHKPTKSDPPSLEALQIGTKIFLQNCAPCHGESGDGRGATAANLVPQPANFKLKQPDSEYLLQVLRDGIPGTAMPSWKDQISEPDRRALAEFVRSLFTAPDSNEP